MYIDIIFLIVLVLLVLYFRRRISTFVYLMCAMDILYKLLHFVGSNVPVPELTNIINKYVPVSLLGLFGNYIGTENVLFTVIKWGIFVLYSIFLFYIIKLILKKGRR